MFELTFENKSSKELYLHVFSLGSFWQVENVFYGHAVIPPPKDQDNFTGKFRKKMRTMVPKEMRAKGLRQCDDILKVLVTSHPTSFDLLELPKIGGLPKKRKDHESRSEVKGSEEWLAFSFPLRTSLATSIV
jgi:hypothetical protein